MKSLRKENACLRKEVSGLRQKTAVLEAENHKLEKENSLLRDDNEQMKRTLGNDSSNSSLPRPWTSRGKRQTHITAENLPGRKKGHSPDTREKGCQKRKWKRKSGKVYLNTERLPFFSTGNLLYHKWLILF